jgi:hypothetical protein
MMGADPVSPLAVVDAGTWEVADGILFSVLSSLVLWSVILTNPARPCPRRFVSVPACSNRRSRLLTADDGVPA